MSAIFTRDPDRSVIELDAYDAPDKQNEGDYGGHPSLLTADPRQFQD